MKQRLWIYPIFAFYYFGAWFSALAIYSKITFQNDDTYLSSFSILLLSILPGIFFAEYIAKIISKFRLINVIYSSLLLSILSVVLMANTNSILLLLLLVFIQACAHKCIAPIRSVVIRNNFSDEELNLANSRMARIQSLSTILAPPIAGGLVAFIGANGALYFDAILGVSAIALSTAIKPVFNSHLPTPTKQREHIERGVFSELKTNFRLTSIPLIAVFLVIIFDIIYPVYIRDSEVGGLIEFSLVLSSFSFGAFLSTWLVRKLKSIIFYPWLLGTTSLGLLIPTGFSGYILILFVVAFLAGASHIQLIVHAHTKLQKLPTFNEKTAVSFELALNIGQLLAVALCMATFVFGLSYQFIAASMIGMTLLLALNMLTANERDTKAYEY